MNDYADIVKFRLARRLTETSGYKCYHKILAIRQYISICEGNFNEYLEYEESYFRTEPDFDNLRPHHLEVIRLYYNFLGSTFSLIAGDYIKHKLTEETDFLCFMFVLRNIWIHIRTDVVTTMSINEDNEKETFDRLDLNKTIELIEREVRKTPIKQIALSYTKRLNPKPHPLRLKEMASRLMDEIKPIYDSKVKEIVTVNCEELESFRKEIQKHRPPIPLNENAYHELILLLDDHDK